MKRIILMLFVSIGGLLFTGCFFGRGIDETIETDRYTMHMQSDSAWVHDGWQWFDSKDTLIIFTTVPEVASVMADKSGTDDSLTMYYFDQRKRFFLPKYNFMLIDSDTTQPTDYTPLLQAMMKRGILRADTTYEPLELLEIYDTARFAAHRKHVKERKSEAVLHVQVSVGEESDDESFQSLTNVVSNLQRSLRIPVILAPGVDPDAKIEYRFMDNEKRPVDNWLDSMGMRRTPDPQGRKMCVIEFNRCKGKI